MPDVYATIAEVDAATAEQVGDAMELRARDPRQRAFATAYLDDLDLPRSKRVLEIGCGTGAISRLIASLVPASDVVGVDPSPHLLARARDLSDDVSHLSFEEGDGRDLPLPDESFDAVVAHTALSHIPGPDRVLSEAFRVLRPDGRLAVFDGDYATMTLATAEADPLQACAAAFTASYIHDPWLMRRLPLLVREAGFAGAELRSFGYVQVTDADYMLSIADRGADALAADGRIGSELAAALKAEARRRIAEHRFFGHIAYASLIAHRPT